MSEQKLRIALVQLNPTVGALKANAKKISSFIKQAEGLKADILIFPELAICGYPPEDLLFKKHFIRDNLKILKIITKEVTETIAVLGFVDQDSQGNLYNAAAIIQNKRIKGIYHKINLPNYGVFDEKRYFSPGKASPIFKLGKIKFAVNICKDIWESDGIVKQQANRGADLLINISASPYCIQKEKLRQKILAQRAKETKAHIAYCNLVGGQDELVFDGASMILSPQGSQLLFADQFSEDLFIAEVFLKHLKRKSHPQKHIQLKLQENRKRPPLVTRKPKRLGRLNEIYCALVLGTRDYIQKNGFKKVVLGLSGGIDSALVATIAADAIGKENVTCVSMPSQYSSRQTKSDTKILACNLGIHLVNVPIDKILKVYLEALKVQFSGKLGVVQENLQARIRGNILMAFSNKFNWLLLNTGNKSETSVGYCTLYGDMAGGFAVIKDVPKMLVYELAKWRNKQGVKKIIPQSVITRAPSAELRRNQKDQDTLPAYSILDAILKDYIEKDKSLESIVATRGKAKIAKAVINMVDKNEYKRRQAPPGIKITPKSFGKDRRFPITNSYREC